MFSVGLRFDLFRLASSISPRTSVVTPRTISSCTSKISSSVLSNFLLHKICWLSACIKFAVTRTLAPDERTDPSTKKSTLNCEMKLSKVELLPWKFILDCRETTDNCLTIENSVNISSKIPSIRKALSSFGFKFLKGIIDTTGFFVFNSFSVKLSLTWVFNLAVFSVENTSKLSEMFLSFFSPAALEIALILSATCSFIAFETKICPAEHCVSSRAAIFTPLP